MDVIDRFKDYEDAVCWQYHQKQETLADDIAIYGDLSLSIDSLEFKFIPKEDKAACKDVVFFIERYEWLGKMPVWVTHRFVATYNDIIIAAVVMGTPYNFSNLLGDEYKNAEKLIARGATMSLAPKNTASWIIMKSVKWMTQNTDFRFFTAYADPLAKELGTVYQACNFTYLGNRYGGGKMYFDPQNPGAGWVGSSYFAQRATIKRIAIEYGVEWQPEYIKPNKTGRKRIIAWENIPDPLEKHIRALVAARRLQSKTIHLPKKHKYVIIQGNNRTETKHLIRLFEERNPELVGLPYPKNRGE